MFSADDTLERTTADWRGSGNAVELFACKDRREMVEPYDRLLSETVEGEALLFAREDEVEAAWSIVEPILKKGHPLFKYEPGSRGPSQADVLLAHLGGWHEPKPVSGA